MIIGKKMMIGAMNVATVIMMVLTMVMIVMMIVIMIAIVKQEQQ